VGTGVREEMGDQIPPATEISTVRKHSYPPKDFGGKATSDFGKKASCIEFHFSSNVEPIFKLAVEPFGSDLKTGGVGALKEVVNNGQ
jgi:hypothetical protein